MGDIINLNSKPRIIKLGGRQERIDRRTKEINENYEKLKERSRARIEKNKENVKKGNLFL